MNKLGKAAIYARVSDPKQLKGSGLDVQIAECKKYAEEMGFEVFDVYKDEGISGAHKANHRLGLGRMLEDARQGRLLSFWCMRWTAWPARPWWG